MKPWMKTVISISLSLMCLFTCIGYAALTSTMEIEGNVKVEIPSGLFITRIDELSKSSNMSVISNSYVNYSTTVNTVLKRTNNSAATVQYEIEVLNNTEREYAYRGLYYMNSYGQNSYVSTSNANNKLGVVTSFPNGKLVGPGETLVFTVTYTIDRRISSSLQLDTMLNFQFGINVDSIDKAYDIVHNKFLDILNVNSTYNELIEVLTINSTDLRPGPPTISETLVMQLITI